MCSAVTVFLKPTVHYRTLEQSFQSLCSLYLVICSDVKSFLFAIVGAEYVLNLLPRGTHKYENFIRPSELYGWAEDAGLNCEQMTGMHYNPLTDAYSLGPGVDVNYIMSTIRP